MRYSHPRTYTHDGCGAVLIRTAPRKAKGDAWSMAKAWDSKSQHSSTLTHITHFGLELCWRCSVPGLFVALELYGLVCLRGDVSVLVRSGGLHSAGVTRRTRAPGRCCWSSLLSIGVPILRPRGCSETNQFGYGPLTVCIFNNGNIR